MLLRASVITALWVSHVSCARQYVPRATSSYHNSTSTSSSKAPDTTDIPTCCYLDSFNVGQLLWYTSSVEVTVATVSTIVYQYNNTAITSYSTVFSNNSFTTGMFDRGQTTISGVPTNIIGLGVGGYEALTTIVYGTVFTDPYGVKYTSPTPVWIYDDVTYRTSMPTSTTSNGVTLYGCPTYAIEFGSGHYLTPYPSGYYSVDPDPKYGQDNQGELFTVLPSGLKDWLVGHVPPTSDTVWSSIASCTLGFGDGIPTAHVPVNQLTGSVITTTTIKGNFGTVIPSSTTTQSAVLPTTSTEAPAPPPSSTPVVVPLSSTPVVLPPSSSALGNSLPTTPAQNPAPGTTLPATTAPVITAGGTTIVGNSNTNFVIGSSTLTPGGTVIVPGSGTQSPTTFVLASSGTAVIVNGATQSVQQTTIPAAAPATSPATIFTAGGSTFTFNSASNVVIGSLTLTPGGTVIIPGSGTVGPTTYVLPTSGSAIIVNGATQSIRVTSVAAPKATTTPLLVVGGTTYTANSASAFVIGSQTLTRGGVITASGVTLSFATAGGTVVQISGGTTSTESLGGIINSVGGFSTATPTYVTASKANHERPISWALSLGLFAGVLGVLVL